MVLYDDQGAYFAQSLSDVNTIGWPQNQVGIEEGKSKHIPDYQPGNNILRSPPLAFEANVRSQNQNLPLQAHHSPIKDLSWTYFTGSPDQEAIRYGNYSPIPESQTSPHFTNEGQNYSHQQSVTSIRNDLTCQDSKVNFTPTALREESQGCIPDQDRRLQQEQLFQYHLQRQQFHQQQQQQELKQSQIQSQLQFQRIEEEEMRQKELKQQQIKQPQMQHPQQLQELKPQVQLQEQNKSSELENEDALNFLDGSMPHSNSLFKISQSSSSPSLFLNETHTSPQVEPSDQNKNTNSKYNSPQKTVIHSCRSKHTVIETPIPPEEWTSLLPASTSQRETNLSRSTSRASAISSSSRESNTPVIHRILENRSNFANSNQIYPHQDTESLPNKQVVFSNTWNVPINFKEIKSSANPSSQKRGRPRGSKSGVKTTRIKKIRQEPFSQNVSKHSAYNQLSFAQQSVFVQQPGFTQQSGYAQKFGYSQQSGYAQQSGYSQQQLAYTQQIRGNFQPSYQQQSPGYPQQISGDSQQLPGYTTPISKPESRQPKSRYVTVPETAHQQPQSIHQSQQRSRSEQLPEYSQQRLQQLPHRTQQHQELFKYVRPLLDYVKETPESRCQLPQYNQISAYNQQLTSQTEGYHEYSQQYTTPIQQISSMNNKYLGPSQQTSVQGQQVPVHGQQVFIQGEQILLQNQQVSLQNQQVLNQNQQVSIQNNRVLVHNQPFVLQNQQVHVQRQQAHLQNQEVLVQQQQTSLINHQILVKNQPTSLQNQQVLVQRQQTSLQDQQVLIQSQQTSLQNQQVFVQSQQLPTHSQQLHAHRQQHSAHIHQLPAHNRQHPSILRQQAPLQIQQLSTQNQHIQQVPIQKQQVPFQAQQLSVQNQQYSTQNQQFPNQNQQFSEKLQGLFEGTHLPQSVQGQHLSSPLQGLSSPSKHLSSPVEHHPSSLNQTPNPMGLSSDQVEHLPENCQKFSPTFANQKQESSQNTPDVSNEVPSSAKPSFLRSWHIPEVLPISESSSESSGHVKSPLVEQTDTAKNAEEITSSQIEEDSMDVEILYYNEITELPSLKETNVASWTPTISLDLASQMHDFEEELQTFGLQLRNEFSETKELRQTNQSQETSQLRKTNKLKQANQVEQVSKVSGNLTSGTLQVPVSGVLVTVRPILLDLPNSAPVPKVPTKFIETSEWLIKSPPQLVIDAATQLKHRVRTKMRWHYKPRPGLKASIKRYRARGFATRSPPVEVFLKEGARNKEIIYEEDDDNDDEYDEKDYHQDTVNNHWVVENNQVAKMTDMQENTIMYTDPVSLREENGHSSNLASDSSEEILTTAQNIIADTNSGELENIRIHHHGLPNLQGLVHKSDRHRYFM